MMRSFIEFILSWVAPIGAIFSFLQFLVPEFEEIFWAFEIIILVISLLLTLVVKLVLYFILNNYEFKEPDRSRLHLKIQYGDIFHKRYNGFVRVVPVDYDLDDNNDERIRKKSLQAQFMSTVVSKEELDELRKKSDRILEYSKGYYLLRISKCTSDHHIELSNYEKYFEMIYELCQKMDNANGDRKFVCSVIGGNIRFGDNNMVSSMQRLQLLKLAIETYNFQQEVEVRIVVKRDWNNLKKYNLRNI